MIKVLHYGLSKNKGGIETYLLNLTTHIDKSKYHFGFIDFENGKVSFREELLGMGCSFHSLTPRRKSHVNYIKELSGLVAQYDIVHCHFNTLSDIAPVLIAVKEKRKAIVHSRSSNAPNSLLTRTAHLINSYRLPHDEIYRIAVSQHAGEWLFGTQIGFDVINNGVDIGKFLFQQEKRLKIREALNLRDSFVVGHVGTFLPVKNHLFILEVFKRLISKKNNIVLLLVGDGPLRKEIMTLVQKSGLGESVLCLGQRDDIGELMSAMDVLLLPSKYEGFPNVLMEAQINKLPCISSDSITNEVKISELCCFLPINDPQPWCQEIMRIADDTTLHRNMPLENMERFSIQSMTKRIETIYDALYTQRANQ